MSLCPSTIGYTALSVRGKRQVRHWNVKFLEICKANFSSLVWLLVLAFSPIKT